MTKTKGVHWKAKWVQILSAKEKPNRKEKTWSIPLQCLDSTSSLPENARCQYIQALQTYTLFKHSHGPTRQTYVRTNAARASELMSVKAERVVVSVSTGSGHGIFSHAYNCALYFYKLDTYNYYRCGNIVHGLPAQNCSTYQTISTSTSCKCSF